MICQNASEYLATAPPYNVPLLLLAGIAGKTGHLLSSLLLPPSTPYLPLPLSPQTPPPPRLHTTVLPFMCSASLFFISATTSPSPIPVRPSLLLLEMTGV